MLILMLLLCSVILLLIILSHFYSLDKLKKYVPMKMKRQLGESPTSAITGSVSYVSYTACTMTGCFSLYTDTMPWGENGHQVKHMNYLATLHQLHSTKTKEWIDGGRSILRHYVSMLIGVGIITKNLTILR
jgi:hypothetical protein